MKFLKSTLILLTLFAGSANSALILQSADYNINASVGNTITANTYPVTGNAVVAPGTELTANPSLTFLSSGFEQTFGGTVSFDLDVDRITVAWSGTAQGVSLLFNFTNMIFDFPGVITGISLVTETCNFAGILCSQVGASLATPTFSGNSITGMGAQNLAGFQPGVSFSQTYSFTTQASNPPPPPPPPPVNVPAPASALLIGLALLGMRFSRFKK